MLLVGTAHSSEVSDAASSSSNALKQRPFARWTIFQRNNELDNSHGAERFSLLYVCAETVAVFHALYISNNSFPPGIAIIQPGDNFGGNWTNFEDPQEVFANTALNNPAGSPNVLFYGGMGKRIQYTIPCWPRYSKHTCFLEKSNNGSIGIWIHQ